MNAITNVEPAGDILVQARDVALTLDGRRVLDHVEFELRDRRRAGCITGQIACILGPSGAGKTRLLRLLAALDEPDRGAITGKDGAPLRRGDVGVVFQDYPVVRHRTVRSNVRLAARIGGLSTARAEARADVLLERFRLAHRSAAYPAELSGGERQRLAIAQQLAVPRALLLFDEPWSGLDPVSLDAVSATLVEVANEHEDNTLVIVTHDIHAALSVADTVLLLGRDGRDEGGGASTIVASYDLVALGIAWHEGAADSEEGRRVAREIRRRFATL